MAGSMEALTRKNAGSSGKAGLSDPVAAEIHHLSSIDYAGLPASDREDKDSTSQAGAE